MDRSSNNNKTSLCISLEDTNVICKRFRRRQAPRRRALILAAIHEPPDKIHESKHVVGWKRSHELCLIEQKHVSRLLF